LGIHPSCTRQWLKEYAALGNGGFPGNGKWARDACSASIASIMNTTPDFQEDLLKSKSKSIYFSLPF